MLTLKPEWKNVLPVLADPAIAKAISAGAQEVRADTGQIICHQGQQCAQLSLLISGVVRVFRVGENGREMTLYRITPGDSCVLSASCILGQKSFPAIARVEHPATAIMVPNHLVREWMAVHEGWRDYIFTLFSNRLTDVISRIDELAFQRVDQRLARYLLDQAGTVRELRLTHQQIADDLGSAREVISRLLKELEQQGFIALTRGCITLNDHQSLALLSQ